MKTISLTLYTFDDLSEKVQKEIIDRERWNIMGQVMDCYNTDYQRSLKKIEETFDFKIANWEVGYCGYHYRIKITKSSAYEYERESYYQNIDLETLSGKLLRRYIHNNILPQLEKGKYHGKLIGTPPDCKQVKRYSKISHTIDCPFTGHCYDMNFLDPFLAYLKAPNDITTTYFDLMNRCVDSFFSQWHREYEYWADDKDAIREELHNNRYEEQLYHKDGTTYNGPMKEVA